MSPQLSPANLSPIHQHGPACFAGRGLLFRPHSPSTKRQKQQAELLKAVRSGDRIVTNSGIMATVITVKEKSLMIRSADAKFEITKSAVAEITERSGESSES
jgi:preprotein translocase YajC subunit